MLNLLNQTESEEMVISLRDVTFAYKGVNNDIDTLENINLNIMEGEFICILGPSGCGKSTLLNIIAGFIKPISGEARMDNKVIEKPDWHKGVVFQAPNLYPWLNVRDNVAFGLKMRGFSKEDIKLITNKYLLQVGLKDYEFYMPYELSGGMRQRVAFARVLVNQPRVVLLDEPFGSLDALTRENMQRLARYIWLNNKCTFVLITHDVDEALSLGTRVLVMSSRPGKLVAEFSTRFTYSITENNIECKRYSDEYLKIRERILDIIINDTI